ncbi:MAG: hypothetical protein V1807_03260 [Patescibacteria group bacterium]
MKQLSTHGTGMTLGSFAALVHLVWLIFVGFGWAKGFADWILSLHMMQFSWSIMPFAWGTAIMLLIMTFVIGYIWGWVFSSLWNYFHK